MYSENIISIISVGAQYIKGNMIASGSEVRVEVEGPRSYLTQWTHKHAKEIEKRIIMQGTK